MQARAHEQHSSLRHTTVAHVLMCPPTPTNVAQCPHAGAFAFPERSAEIIPHLHLGFLQQERAPRDKLPSKQERDTPPSSRRSRSPRASRGGLRNRALLGQRTLQNQAALPTSTCTRGVSSVAESAGSDDRDMHARAGNSMVHSRSS
jgi:hypothetical protein